MLRAASWQRSVCGKIKHLSSVGRQSRLGSLKPHCNSMQTACISSPQAARGRGVRPATGARPAAWPQRAGVVRKPGWRRRCGLHNARWRAGCSRKRLAAAAHCMRGATGSCLPLCCVLLQLAAHWGKRSCWPDGRRRPCPTPCPATARCTPLLLPLPTRHSWWSLQVIIAALSYHAARLCAMQPHLSLPPAGARRRWSRPQLPWLSAALTMPLHQHTASYQCLYMSDSSASRWGRLEGGTRPSVDPKNRSRPRPQALPLLRGYGRSPARRAKGYNRPKSTFARNGT